MYTYAHTWSDTFVQTYTATSYYIHIKDKQMRIFPGQIKNLNFIPGPGDSCLERTMLHVYPFCLHRLGCLLLELVSADNKTCDLAVARLHLPTTADTTHPRYCGPGQRPHPNS